MNRVAVVIASYERPKLLQQTIESLVKNTDNPFEIVLVDDFSQNPEVDAYMNTLLASVLSGSLTKITYERYPFRVPIHTIKNRGELMAAPSEFIHFSDNDVYYEPHWDSRLISVLDTHPEIGIVGGAHHPHHQVDSWDGQIVFSNDQPGYSVFIRRDDFKKFGPWFSEQSVGGEDSNFCMMARQAGYKIAALNPSVVLHCGASGSTGNKAADYPQIMQMKAERADIYVE